MATAWFNTVFGFTESPSYSGNQAHFTVEDAADGKYLHSAGNKKKFFVGTFEIPTVETLRTTLSSLPQVSAGVATFEHVNGDVRSYIRDVANAGAVFQAASQFNCLEMVGPGVSPDRGISIYALDPTQGPAVAQACPAATAYRNYIAPAGKGQGGAGERMQINCLREVESLIENSKHNYWQMSNGYTIPTTTSKMAQLTSAIGSPDSPLGRGIVGKLAVGIHWSTEVNTAIKHRVALVFSSAVPVAYCKSTKSADWALFASLVLEATFEATILTGAILSRQKGARVPVFLTAVGGGAFGNRIEWIVRSIQLAMSKYADEAIDVRVVHYGTVIPEMFQSISVPKGSSSKDTSPQPLLAGVHAALTFDCMEADGRGIDVIVSELCAPSTIERLRCVGGRLRLINLRGRCVPPILACLAELASGLAALLSSLEVSDKDAIEKDPELLAHVMAVCTRLKGLNLGGAAASHNVVAPS